MSETADYRALLAENERLRAALAEQHHLHGEAWVHGDWESLADAVARAIPLWDPTHPLAVAGASEGSDR